MALLLEVKSIISPDLEYGAIPVEPDNCSVLVELQIGEEGKEGSEVFSFTAVTPKFLTLHPETRWGRGYLIVPQFSWPLIEAMLGRLLQRTRRDSWPEVARELSKELHWEFENYKPWP